MPPRLSAVRNVRDQRRCVRRRREVKVHLVDRCGREEGAASGPVAAGKIVENKIKHSFMLTASKYKVGNKIKHLFGPE